jgi:hypothetical protein
MYVRTVATHTVCTYYIRICPRALPASRQNPASQERAQGRGFGEGNARFPPRASLFSLFISSHNLKSNSNLK